MSAGADVPLRAASADDLDAIADLFLACWTMSYRQVLPRHVVGIHGPASARDLWRHSLGGGADAAQVMVAEHPDGSLAGVVAMGRDEDDASRGHIFSLYVHPEAQRSGIGARLVSEAIERFRAEGLWEASLWVFEANAAARAFYERLGWHADGTSRVEPAYGEPEIRLIRPVVAADRPPRRRRHAARP